MEKYYGFVYITTNMINGKRYIGQHKFKKDWKYYLGSGVIIKRAIKKYGRENFVRDIVALTYTKEELNHLEEEFIKNYNAVYDDNYYNISSASMGGNGTMDGKTEEEIKIIRHKMSESHKKYTQENSYWFGKNKTDETKDKISNSLKGRFVGDKHPLYGIRRLDMEGENHPQAKRVICITTDKVFNTIKEAVEYYNIKSPSHIGGCCRRERNYCGKLDDGTRLEWQYYEDCDSVDKVQCTTHASQSLIVVNYDGVEYIRDINLQIN